MAPSKTPTLKPMTTGRPKKKCECGENMIIYKRAENWQSFWKCEKCGKEKPKVKGDVEFWG